MSPEMLKERRRQMKKHWKVVGLALVAVTVLAAAGMAGGGRDDGVGPLAYEEDEALAGDTVTAAIDKALGRETQAVVTRQTAGVAEPAQKSSAPPPAMAPAPADASTASGAGGVTTTNASPSTTLDGPQDRADGSLRMQVKVGGSFEEVGRIASSVGGFVASSTSPSRANSRSQP
jgi:hypothetical protein